MISNNAKVADLKLEIKDLIGQKLK